MIAVCAALYAIVGYFTNLGVVSPVVGVVRFWPSVIVPAVFAVLFGPWVGGIGAAIGIFFADIIYPGHGPSSTIRHEKDNNPFLQNGTDGLK